MAGVGFRQNRRIVRTTRDPIDRASATGSSTQVRKPTGTNEKALSVECLLDVFDALGPAVECSLMETTVATAWGW